MATVSALYFAALTLLLSFNAATATTLRCDMAGQALVATGGSGMLVGSIDAPPTNDLDSVVLCTWTIGNPGAITQLSNMLADGDPTSSYLVIYGACLFACLIAVRPIQVTGDALQSGTGPLP